jgi:WD40 repeat protein
VTDRDGAPIGQQFNLARHVPLDSGGEPRGMRWSISADGSTVVGGVVKAASTYIVAFDAVTSDLVWKYATSRDGVSLGVPNPDGTTIATVADDTHRIDLWDITSDELIRQFRVEDALPLGTFVNSEPVFDDDGSRIAVATSQFGTIAVVDVASGRWTVSEPAGGAVVQGTVSWVPGSDQVVASGTGGTLWRWDMSSGNLLASGQSDDPGNLGGAVVSPDATTVAASHPFSPSVALFDLETLRPIGRPIATGERSGVPPFFSPSGRTVLTSDVFEQVVELDVDPDSWERTACRAAGRNLTLVEWREYIGADVPYRVTCAEWPPGT